MSNKWKWIKTLPVAPESIGKSLKMVYVCKKCGKEFIAHEKAQVKIVSSVDKCYFCRSGRLTKTSEPDADIELYYCNMCHCYIVLKI